MTCKHDWVVRSISDVDEMLMETHGHFNLTCTACGAHARLERPTYYECYMVAKAWLEDGDTFWVDTGDGRLVIVLEGTRADDLLTAGDDDNIDSVGTMGWLQLVDNKANEIDQILGFGAATPTSCNHYWHVGGIIGQGTDGAEIELQCARCHEYATVLHVTDDECETIAKAWSMGMALEWQDARRLTLYRDLQRPPVADLVDRLDLFETDEGDDDVPF